MEFQEFNTPVNQILSQNSNNIDQAFYLSTIISINQSSIAPSIKQSQQLIINKLEVASGLVDLV